MASLFGHFEVGDYDAWKKMFDSDPAGRAELGKGHRIYRSVANPSEVFVAVEFSSEEGQGSFGTSSSRRERWTTSPSRPSRLWSRKRRASSTSWLPE